MVMKTNNSIIFKLFNFCIAAASLMLVACDSDSIEGLKGEFSDVTFCDFNSASVQPTVKLGKGIKALNTQFTDAAGNSLSLSFGSKEWILGEGTYLPVATVSTAGTYAGSVNGDTQSILKFSSPPQELRYRTSPPRWLPSPPLPIRMWNTLPT